MQLRGADNVLYAQSAVCHLVGGISFGAVRKSSLESSRVELKDGKKQAGASLAESQQKPESPGFANCLLRGR